MSPSSTPTATNDDRPDARWIIAAIAMKLAVAIGLLIAFNEHRGGPGFRFFSDSGDVADYVRPVENLLRTGEYTTDPSYPLGAVHRMPGYAFTLLPFRALLPLDVAKGFLVAFQLTVECIAVFCVGDLTSRLARSRSAGHFAMSLYAVSSFVTVFTCKIIPDGLSANLTLIVAWQFIRNRGGMSRSALLATGAAFIYLVFLRPFLAPLALPFAWMILTDAAAGPPRRWVRLSVFLAVPVLAESAWVIRNYVRVGEPILFHVAGVRHPPADTALRRWITSFGGDFVWWRPGSELAWFMPGSPFHDPTWKLTEAPLTSSCPLDRVLEGRSHYLAYRSSAGAAGDEHGRRVAMIFDSCRMAYEAEKRFDHHVVARIRLIRRFLVHGGPPLPLPRFVALSTRDIRYWVKLGSVAVYYLTVVLGCAGIVLLFMKPRIDRAFIAVIATYLLLVFPWALRFIENRFLAAAYPFLAVASGISCAAVLEALMAWRSTQPR